MNKNAVLRVARPTDNLEEVARMYIDGLGFERLAEFKDHDGFDGVILGLRSHSYHLEFTQCAGEVAGKAPTKDNLLVFYVPNKPEWVRACKRMEQAGFSCVDSFNPYWDVSGKTFEDVDGYRVVIQNEQWPGQGTTRLLMQTHTLRDGKASFKVSIHEGAGSAPTVLFAVGSGGQPERHATLLETLAESGCTVIAPHFERLSSPSPREAEITLRARRLRLALDSFLERGETAAGVGHSIGATTLLALAGGQMWLGPGRRVDIPPDNRLTRLTLLAPPTGFFQAPDALNAVRLPILAWVGSQDDITPPAQTEWLARTMRDWQPVEVRITDGAGHFSFMDSPPPHAVEPLQDKRAFLREHASEICRFVVKR